jgi:hypothetical protein
MKHFHHTIKSHQLHTKSFNFFSFLIHAKEFLTTVLVYFIDLRYDFEFYRLYFLSVLKDYSFSELTFVFVLNFLIVFFML